MTDNQKQWLEAIYDDAITEHYGIAENERTWADGLPRSRDRDMHLANAREHDDFAAWLEEQKDNIQTL